MSKDDSHDAIRLHNTPHLDDRATEPSLELVCRDVGVGFSIGRVLDYFLRLRCKRGAKRIRDKDVRSSA